MKKILFVLLALSMSSAFADFNFKDALTKVSSAIASKDSLTAEKQELYKSVASYLNEGNFAKIKEQFTDFMKKTTDNPDFDVVTFADKTLDYIKTNYLDKATAEANASSGSWLSKLKAKSSKLSGKAEEIKKYYDELVADVSKYTERGVELKKFTQEQLKALKLDYTQEAK